MRDNYVWKMIMVGDFTDCPSCDEPCGYVWFVKAEFDLTTGLPVCINTRNTDEGPILHKEEASCWSPRHMARENGAAHIAQFLAAAEGPLYKLKDFCKGGSYEEGIYQRNVRTNAKYEGYGLPTEEPDLPDEILWPIREDYP